MLLEESYINERLAHLRIVAGVCQEIGPTSELVREIASWFHILTTLFVCVA
jgi:hypothetical protein